MSKFMMFWVCFLVVFSGFLFSVFSQKGTPSTVAASSLDLATLEAFQRKAFFAVGKFWVFYSDGVDIRYKTSLDGLTWSSATYVCSGGHGQCFSVWFDGIYVHYVKGSQGIGDVKYRRGEPNSDGTLSWSTGEQTIFSSQALYVYEVYISVDSEGCPWVGYRWGFDGAGRYPNCTKSSLNNGTWRTAPGFPYRLSSISTGDWIVSVVPLTNGKVYAIYLPAGAVRGRIWNGTAWGNEEVVTTAGIIRRFAHSVVALRDDVHLAFLEGPSFDVLYFKRIWGSGWGSKEVVEASQSNVSYPVLSVDKMRSDVYCFWGYNDIVYYKRRVLGTWNSTAVAWVLDHDLIEDTLTSFYEAGGSKLGVVWTQGVVSPFSVRFACVGLPTPLGVRNLDTGLEYATIQEAIDASETLDGHRIFVFEGAYVGPVTVGKSLSLIGEDEGATIIDGNGSLSVIRVFADNVSVSGFSICNGNWSVFVEGFDSVIICENVISGCDRGVFLSGCNGGAISGNRILGCRSSIELWNSNRTMIRDNRISGMQYGVYLLYGSCDNVVKGNVMWDSPYEGISLSWYCNGNTVIGNTVTLCGYGIVCGGGSDNVICHNNFIDNVVQVYSYSSSDVWDDGVKGNYWSDYGGLDDGSGGRVAGDGVGDTLLPWHGLDYRPLIVPWGLVPIFWEGVMYSVCIVSNSTVSEFGFSQPLRRISFDVSGPSGSVGFCNVTFPNSLLWGDFSVLVDGGSPREIVRRDNATHISLFFTFEVVSSRRVWIIGEFVVPEFSSWLSIVLMLVFLTVIMGFRRRKVIGFC